MVSLLAYQNFVATFEMCIIHSMMSAHFQFSCMRAISKEVDGAKGSNYLLQFGAVFIRD